jgi:nitrogen regulatory protein PII
MKQKKFDAVLDVLSDLDDVMGLVRTLQEVDGRGRKTEIFRRVTTQTLQNDLQKIRSRIFKIL